MGYKQTELRSRKRKYGRATTGATGPTAAKARRGTVVEEKSTSVDGGAAVIRIDLAIQFRAAVRSYRIQIVISALASGYIYELRCNTVCSGNRTCSGRGGPVLGPVGLACLPMPSLHRKAPLSLVGDHLSLGT